MKDYIEYYKGKTVLVTGGAGAIGSNLVKQLSSIGVKKVIILDDLSAGHEWLIPQEPNVLFVRGSVVDEIDLKRVFNEKPEVVFHLAAFFANQNSVDYPQHDLNVNGMGTLLLLQYCVMSSVKRFVYASSGCSIYGSNAPLPLTEEFMSMHLTTPYQITKMLGELYCNFFYHHYGIPVVKARFFNSYGPGEVPGQYRNVIPNFIYFAMKGIDLPFTGQADASRDFTYVGDLVDGLLRCGYYEKAIGEEMNLASGREIRILDMAEKVIALSGSSSKIQTAPARKWDTKNRLLASISKAKELIGYEPNMDFEEGLHKTIQWFREHWNKIEKQAAFTRGSSSAVAGIVVQDKDPKELGKHVAECAS